VKLALFDDYRLGVVIGTAPGDGAAVGAVGADARVVDVTGALPWPHDPDPVTAGWWRRLCRDFGAVRPALEAAAGAAGGAAGRPVREVRLRTPVLNPSKIVAVASNYAAHVAEMHDVQRRTLGRVESWMMEFDVFLKAPSSLSGPRDDIVLPETEVAAGHEIHHEAELVVIIGTGGRDIAESAALDHVLGYTIGLDVTVRSEGDRSRRKSYDTFSPVGPWITTRDEAPPPGGFQIDLVVNGDEHRQHVSTATMRTPVSAIISYASRMMTLLPGDLIFTGAPPGVGPVHAGDVLQSRISHIGEMRTRVR
jgi:2-keto-4-pentenoate hydratase/2-oxohepta-3-ene-1,7-dioic acid hydratase in catechol pathway